MQEFLDLIKSVAKSILKSLGLIMASVFLGFMGIFALIGLSAGTYLLSVNASLPTYAELLERDIPESSKVYSRDGTLMYEFHGEYKRTQIDLEQVSPYLVDATIAVEDKDFYNHGAISIEGIARALKANYESGSPAQGGSTITQQYVKNALLDRSKLYSRKIREVLLSYKVEAHFTKDEILELYLNEIPYGRNAYGVEAAAQSYFGKSATQLNLAESAYLASFPQAPSLYSPTGSNPEALENRKELVLTLMRDQGYITDLELNQAQNTKVEFQPVKTEIIAPYYISWIQNYLTEKYGQEFLREGGLKVYTSIDLKLQALAEKVVKEGAEKNKSSNRAYNAALVAVDSKTNKVLAMVGGKDYFGAPEPAGCRVGVNCKFEPNVNVATSLRQPGSSFKPYAYLTAFKPEFGYTPLSKVLDVPKSFGTYGGRAYIPQNYDGSSHGLITIRKALAGSLNVPAVRTLEAVGVDNVVETAHSLGISAPLKDCGLSLVLGGCEVELVDHATAFSVLANGGKAATGSPFIRIEDKNGKILEESSNQAVQVVNPEAVYELTSILTDDQSRQYVFGPNNPLKFDDGRPVAAKTGTTQNWKDGWTLGFTPQITVGVWTGNNDSSLMRAGADGVFTAAPIWKAFMEEAHKELPVENFSVPSGIVQVAYNIYSNRPATAESSSTRMEPIPWYAIPKDIQVSATPNNLRDTLIGPLENNSSATIKNINNSAPKTQSSSNQQAQIAPAVQVSPSPVTIVPDYQIIPSPVDYGGSNEPITDPSSVPIIIPDSSALDPFTRPNI
ncbi:MAG: PBP1A family penicillin-binding protein [Candidatus Doudnabacteria bacterium]